jgi:hypothetical protein
MPEFDPCQFLKYLQIEIGEDQFADASKAKF